MQDTGKREEIPGRVLASEARAVCRAVEKD